MAALREIYGYRIFSGRGARDLIEWRSSWTMRQRRRARTVRDHGEQLRRKELLTITYHSSKLESLLSNGDKSRLSALFSGELQPC
jgi:ribosomal protein S4